MKRLDLWVYGDIETFRAGTLARRALVAKRYRLVAPAAVADKVLRVVKRSRARAGIVLAITVIRTVPVALYALSATHTHVDEESRDCDGRMDRAYVSRINDRRRDAFDLLADPLRYRDTSYGTDGRRSVSYFERTDEGYRSGWVRYCADDCAYTSSQRDHSAEAAGY